LSDNEIKPPEENGESTPEEQIAAGIEQIEADVRGELLQRVKSISPEAFERLVLQLLGAAKTVSSLTLFAAAGLASAHELLNQLGRRCELTCELLRTAP